MYEKLGALEQSDVDSLFCTLDESCRKNVEFSEFSNEVLFDVLNESPEMFIKSLNGLKEEVKNYIKAELERPVGDKYVPNDLIKKIDPEMEGSQLVIDALKVAQSKY